MHNIEPYYNWRGYYMSSEDPESPFYGREYSEFEFSEKIYNHYIHPQWDDFGSQTLFMKVLYVSYVEGFAIMEFIGEWNDLLYNDIMFLKREIAEDMMLKGITKFILIGENVLNFHFSDDSYYDEWFEEVTDADGWIALLNFREHVLKDMSHAQLDKYFVAGGQLNALKWRTMNPDQLCEQVEKHVLKRIGL
ncbi:MAG: hypothetical protein ACKOW8_15480 [Flavobacteriales bacterium]